MLHSCAQAAGGLIQRGWFVCDGAGRWTAEAAAAAAVVPASCDEVMRNHLGDKSCAVLHQFCLVYIDLLGIACVTCQQAHTLQQRHKQHCSNASTAAQRLMLCCL